MKGFHISQMYDPKEHTGALRIEEERQCLANDGWIITSYMVYLECHDGTVDWVEDFADRRHAERFVESCKAEITLLKGHV